MNVLVVDTSSWISYFDGTANAELELALEEGRVYLPSIVCAELLSGKMAPEERSGLESLLRELPLCETTVEHWIRVGGLRWRLSTRGVTLSTPDAHVAQCALDLQGYLLTKDRVFAKVAKVVPLKLL